MHRMESHRIDSSYVRLQAQQKSRALMYIIDQVFGSSFRKPGAEIEHHAYFYCSQP